VTKNPIRYPKNTAERRMSVCFLIRKIIQIKVKKAFLKILVKKLKNRSKAAPISLKSVLKSTSSFWLGVLEFVLIMN
jgi:hypothetical protein